MIGPILPEHHPAILAMNAEFLPWLGHLDAEKLDEMLSSATYARQIGGGEGVLIAFDHNAGYSHKCLDWQAAHFDAFLYIDRIIIAKDAHGRGHGRALYADIERFARKHAYPRLVCEVNTKPDNPRSHRFHLDLGFVPVADIDYPAYNAVLRYYEKPLL